MSQITFILESNDPSFVDYLEKIMRFNTTNVIGMFNRTWAVESFDVSINRAPDSYTLGSRLVIPGIEMDRDIEIRMLQAEDHVPTGLRL
jgi:hypothetical protein